MKRLITLLYIVVLWFSGMQIAAQVQRFPKPEFESGHTQPPTILQEPRATTWEYVDIFVLIACLSIVSWLVVYKRSRKGVFWMSMFSLAYFGFFREGCVCSVGSLQNIALALIEPSYSIPISVIAFFMLPLLYTLFFGRTFCAGVCPLGAIQDLFIWKPQNVKDWVQKALGLIPFIYLGLSILYAVTKTDFIICRYDPFIGIFRFNGTFFMYSLGAIFLLTSLFIARPYCRFFCPYGVILKLVSKFSKKHLTITPAKCIQCKLCENSCPFGAIDTPVETKENESKTTAVRRYILLSLLVPVLMLIGAWVGGRFHENLARVHPTVKLAQEMLNRTSESVETESLEITAFKSAGKPVEQLYAEAASILDDFYTGALLLGAFLGLVFGLTLARLSVFQHRTDYEANKGDCLSCARCVDYCPVEKEL